MATRRRTKKEGTAAKPASKPAAKAGAKAVRKRATKKKVENPFSDCVNQRFYTDQGPGKKLRKICKTPGDLGDQDVTFTVYAGCIDGDRVSPILSGNDRAVALYGSTEQHVAYALGDSVTLEGRTVPEAFRAGYQRQLDRKEEAAVQRIKDEMAGKGDAARDAKAHAAGKVDGVVYTANGQNVDLTARLNQCYSWMTMIENDGKNVPKPVDDLAEADVRVQVDGADVQYFGGLDLVVAAKITPGMEYRR